MDQFNNSDHSGMVGFLVGIIVLVFAGILFSLLADKRFRFSSNRITLEEQVAEGAHEVEAAKSRLENLRKTWRESYQPLASQGSSLQSATAAVKAGEARIASLREEKSSAAAAISAATLAFDDYSTRYRVQVRAAAIGEKIPELKARSGKVYNDVTIRKVAADGIEFRHEHGNSHLLPEDLDPPWHERFQWTRDELSKALDEEKARQERRSQLADDDDDDDPPAKPASKPKAKEEPEDSKLQDIREEVIQARTRYLTAQSEASRARSEANGFNRGKSVPGSLETWAQRAVRLEGTATKLRAQYMNARGKLAAVAPRDALLQQVEDQ